MVEHHIQRTIIERLQFQSSMRFRDLKPDGLESNIFMYHVKQLIKSGFVKKTAIGYALDHKGLSYVDGLSSSTLRPREQPKLIAIMGVHDDAGRWLLAERKSQPYIGQLMLPSGKQHLGESVEAHARRELQEKTGLTVPLTYRGVGDIRINRSGQLLTHSVAHVFTGSTASVAVPETDRFMYRWAKPEDIAPADFMPGTLELIRLLQGTTMPFLTEFVFETSEP